MRKRLLLCYSLAIFMLFSFVRCSQEILDVQDNLGTFTKEARLYFEQNASDIQTVRVGNQKESLSRSMALSSRVITPNWEEGESIKRGAISSLEIPLTGDVYVKSFYSSTRDGLPSLSNVQTKLVIQKHDELKEMRSFVVTIIAAKRYEIMHAQSTQTFSFLNPNNFSGLMIVSDLEGNYLDAFQFTDGKQQRVVLARASGMEETDIDENDVVSTFTLMDASSAGMYSRSGEGGGGGGTPVYPDIPEVTVTYCKRCGVPIEECPGHCPICNLPLTRCPGHYTPPPTQWYCPYCHSPYCPGTCYTGGGSSTPTTPVGPQGDYSKDIFSSDSRLTPEQWKKIEDLLKKINNDCMGGALVKALNGKHITVLQNSNMKTSGHYDHKTNKLTIKDFSESKDNDSVERTLLHELLHSQHADISEAKLNLEIQVHFAVYRYATRNSNVPINGEVYMHMAELDLIMDSHCNTTNSDFNAIYKDIISDFRKGDTYKNYPESESARNFDVVKKLSVNCND